MTRWLSALLAGAMAFSLAACGRREQAGVVSPYSPLEMAQVMLATLAQPAALVAVTPDSADFTYQLENGYTIDAARVEDGAICYSAGFEATEVAVLLLRDEAAVEETADALLAYIQGRAEAFEGYAPEQAALAGRGEVITHGRYVALAICDSATARDAFLACFGSQPPALPASSPFVAPQSVSLPAENRDDSPAATSGSAAEPEAPTTDDAYAPEAILAAWQSGDRSALSPKNAAILQACEAVIGEVVTDGMSAYDKELAVHDWIITWGDYDWAVNSKDKNARPDPDNDNPYGLLINQKAICRGYATTFQLFMDLLGIECITVEGTANPDREEHAWNLVRLDGEWYCVDVTWDDPYGQSAPDPAQAHRFFNVTSQFLRDTAHYWDETTAPECTATTHRYRG